MFDVVWPITLLVAWLLGELGLRWLSLPRISSYALVGILITFGIAFGRNFFPLEDIWALSLIPQIAFGLILFELGYRINFTWLRNNRWLGITSLAEASLTFVVVFLLGKLFALGNLPASLLAALATATSPMTIVPVIDELRSAGQVTERTLHLSALNCIFAIVSFTCLVGFWMLRSAGDPLQAFWDSLAVLAVSAGLGVLFGVLVPWLLHITCATDRAASVAYALAIAGLAVLTHALYFSSILATLIFGMTARHRRSCHRHAQPSFGVLGDLLLIVLFVHIGTRFASASLLPGLGLGLAVLGARWATKGACTLAFSRLSGLSLKKGLLTGLALTPMASFAILLLDLSARRGLAFPETLAAMTGILLLVDIASPAITRFILKQAGECPPAKDN